MIPFYEILMHYNKKKLLIMKKNIKILFKYVLWIWSLCKIKRIIIKIFLKIFLIFNSIKDNRLLMLSIKNSKNVNYNQILCKELFNQYFLIQFSKNVLAQDRFRVVEEDPIPGLKIRLVLVIFNQFYNHVLIHLHWAWNKLIGRPFKKY